MKKSIVKAFALILALCLMLGAFPLSASAADKYAATITYNSGYGYARMESDEYEGGRYGYLYAIPNDACLVEKITVINDSTGEEIYSSYNRTLTYRDGTVSQVYSFRMPYSTVSVDVKFRPAKEEKQIELLCDDSDLGFLRTENNTNIAIPTSTVRIYVCPFENEAAGRDNVIRDVTCVTESGAEIPVSKRSSTIDYTIYHFTMPDENVRVSASFAPPSGWRRLQREATENGRLTVPASFGQVGSDVTVTAKPDTGYVLDALYYVERETGRRIELGAAEGKTDYTFSMPDADITVYAHFGLSGSAHTITTSCDGKLGGQINMNTYVASPGEYVNATVIPYNRHQVKDVVCVNKKTGDEMDVTVTGDSYRMEIEFSMPDADVEIIASYIFPSVTLKAPLISLYEGKPRTERRAEYDADTHTYSVEVYDDTESVELHVCNTYFMITVSCEANGFYAEKQHYYSGNVPLSEGVTELHIIGDADDPNGGEHMHAEYTLLISRTKRYVPVERIVLDNGATEKVMKYSMAYMPLGWLPSVTYYPENADQKSVRWTTSDPSILRYGDAGEAFDIITGEEKLFYPRNKSGIVTVTATTPDGVSASMKVIVGNDMYRGTLTYEPGEGTCTKPLFPTLAGDLFSDENNLSLIVRTDVVKLNNCTFTPPEGKVFKAWSYNGEEYAPGDWIVLTSREVTVTAIYEDLYTVEWLKEDGSLLDKKTYTAREAIPSTEMIPVKAADYYNTYTFDKWDDGTVSGKTTTYRPLFTTHEKEQSTYLIHVNNLIGQPVTIEVEATDTIAAVKEKLFNADGTPIDEQYLVYNNTLLRDEMTLADYDIHKEAVLDMAHQGAIRTVVWLDADGEELAREIYYKDEAEPVTRMIPVKAEDRTHTYTFNKWDEGTVDGAVTTYAPIWTAHEKPFYYIYVGYGTADVVTAYPGDIVTLTPDPADEHGYYAGWNVIGDNAEVTDNSFVMPEDHVYVYARYNLKKIPSASLDFSSETNYVGKPLSISGELSYDDELLDLGGEATITLSAGAPEDEGAVSYVVPVEHGKYSLDIPALTTDNRYVWFDYPGEGIYGRALVSTTINVYTISTASLDVALYEEDVKTEYERGEALNTDNLYIWIFWNDGTVEKYPVTPEMVSGFDSSSAGELTLTVACPYPYEEELTYTVTVKPGETIILGDADGDGDVTIFDATAIQRFLAELSTGSFNEAAADADGDGDVTIFDATAIQRFLAQLSSNENIGKPIA